MQNSAGQNTDSKDGAKRSFFRLTAVALGAALAVATGGTALAAPTLTVLHSFTGGATDGAAPNAGLLADSGGNLYGTTTGGGGSGCSGSECGVVYKLSPDGTSFRVLHSFTGGGGSEPTGVIRDLRGNLYGTTRFGGAGSCFGTRGCGVVFKLSASGTYTVLHYFTDGDGSEPLAGLFADGFGNLYGTTSAGGRYGYGTVFKLTPNGTYSVLHSFSGSDGAYPTAELIGRSGRFSTTLYGTASGGGASNRGVVFKLLDCNGPIFCGPPPSR